jgi:hypothetical protein
MVQIEDTPISMRGFASNGRSSAILAAAAMVWLSTAALLGYGYMHYQRLAAYQEAATRRVESMNTDLQAALEQLRNETQKTLQKLRTENALQQERIAQLEQRASLPSAGAGSTGAYQKVSSVRSTIAPPSATVMAGASAAEPLEVPANFRAPNWVPDYFSNERASAGRSE